MISTDKGSGNFWFKLRCIFIGFCWLTLVPWGLWQLRETISLCQEYCTWAAVRLGLEFHPWATLAFSLSLAFTTSVLIWHSSHILQGGLSAKEKYYLTQKVKKIRQQGNKNLLWRWLQKP